jgi:HSP20 family molecular chaperone IbpA
MHTIIHPPKPSHRSRTVESPDRAKFRQPSFDCRELPDAIKLVVYVPGVDANSVAIEARGPDLIVTARKTHVVRVNWQYLHLEGAQRDYQLRLRLGHNLVYAALQAELHCGVLTLLLPKRQPVSSDDRLRHVA